MKKEEEKQTEFQEEVLRRLDNIELFVKKQAAPFLSMDEAAEYLRLPVDTLYGYTSQNKIPFYKLNGRRNYFLIADLNEFILSKENLHVTADEMETENITNAILSIDENNWSRN